MAGGDPLEGKNKRAALKDALATDLSEWQGIQALTPEVRGNLEQFQLPLAPFSPNQPSNVRANDPTGDLANETQSEVSVAAWNQYVVVTWFDSKDYISSFKGVGYAYSCDFGQTFTDGGGPPELDPSDMYLHPVVTADNAGNFYLAANYGPFGFTQDTHAVWRGTWNGCVFSLAAPVLATVIDAPQVTAGDYLVRPRIAASPMGPLFLTYVYFLGTGGGRVEVVVSLDQGATWSDPVVLEQGGFPLTPDVSVGSDGLACVAWDNEYRAFIFCDLSGVDVPSHVSFCKSTDTQGTSWTPALMIAERGAIRLMSGPGDFRGWDYSSAAIKVDPTTPSKIGITWHESADWTAPVETGNSVAESEPNDTPSQALTLPVGDMGTGGMTATGQRDYWKVHLNAGDNYFARLIPADFVCGVSGTTRGFQMYLYADAANPTVHPPDTLLARSFPSAYVAQITFTAHKTGDYYLRVQQNTGTPEGYTLRTGLVSFTRVDATRPARDFSDIVAIYSSDAGNTWSQKILVNADAPAGYYEAYPSITVDNVSKVRVFWYDHRQTQNVAVNTAQLTDLYMAEGPWGSFGPGQRISDVSTTNSGISRITLAPGEYEGAWSDGGHVFASWADQRNSATTSHFDAYTQFLDFEPPTTVFETAPADGAYLTTTSVPFEWAGTDRNPLNATLQYSTQLDNGGFGTFGPDTTTTLILSEGQHTVQVRAQDQAGNVESTASRTFFVDLSDPSVTIMRPSGTTGPNVRFDWDGNDALTLDADLEYAYRLDAGGFSSFAPGTSTTLSNLSTGPHTFEVQVRDRAGRTANATRSITVERGVHWVVDGDGNWDDPLNWDKAATPTAADTVIIDRPGGTFRITVASAPSALKLSCAETLNLTGSLTLGSDSEISGRLDLSAGPLSVSGNLLISGTLNWTGGTMSGTGTTTLADGNHTFAGGAKTVSARTLSNQGHISWTGSDLLLNAGATFNNLDTLDVSSAATVRSLSGAGTFNNSGVLIKQTSSLLTFANTTNLTNTGLFDIQGGSIQLQRGTALAGQVAIAAGASLDCNSGTITLNGTISGAGTLLASGVSTVFANGTYQMQGLSVTPSTTFNLSHSDTIPAVTVTGGTLSVSGSLLVSSSLQWSGGTMDGTGTTTLAAGTHTLFNTTKTLSGRTLRNDGTVSWTVGSVNLTNGAQFLNYGSMTSLHTLGNLSMSAGTGGGTFKNYGLFTKSGSTTRFVQFTGTSMVVENYDTLSVLAGRMVVGGSSFTNQGALVVADGSSNLVDIGSFSNSGTIDVGAFAVVDIVGPFSNLSGTTLTGGIYKVQGVLGLPGRVETNAADITLIDVNSIIANDLSNAGALDSLALNDASGSLTLSGNAGLILPNGSFTNAGAVTVGAGTTLQLTGSPPDYIQTAGTTIVDGTLQANLVDMQAGTLGGSGTVTAYIQNAGTVSPGTSPGVMTVYDYTQEVDGHLTIEIAGISGGTQFDRLVSQHGAVLNGNLDVSLVNGFTPVAGQSFSILNYDTYSGSFSTLNLPALHGGLAWSALPGPHDFILSVAEADTVPPSIVFTSGPAEYGVVIGPAATFNWTASDLITPRPSLVFSYRLDSDPFTAFGPDTTATVAGLSFGAHSFEVRAKDQAGNIGTILRNFSSDVAVRWNVDANGDWNTGANWNTGTVPTSADSVVIDRPAGFFAVTVSSTANARALVCAESLAVTAGTFTLGDDSQISGSLAISGSTTTVEVTGDLIVSGLLNWSAGTMRGVGTTRLISGATALISSTSAKTLQERTLRNEANLTWSGGIVNLRDGAILENTGIMIENSAGATTLRRTSGTTSDVFFTNAGVFRKTGPALTTLGTTGLTVTNSGNMRVENFVLSFNGNSNVTGTVDLDGGTVWIQGGVHDFSVGSRVRGPLDRMRVSSASVTLSGDLDIKHLWLDGTTSFSLAHPDTIPRLSILSAGSSLSVDGDLLVNEDLQWDAGTVNVAGTMLLASSAFWVKEAIDVCTLAGGTLRTEGTIIWQLGGDLVLEAGTTFENADSLNFGAYYDYGLYPRTIKGGGVFRNLGVFHSESISPVFVGPGLTIENSGSMDFDAGSLSLDGTVSSGGIVDATGASVVLAGGTQSFPPGSHILGASLSATGAAVTINGLYDFNSTSVDSGSLVLDHADTLSQLRVRGGTLSVNGDLRVGSLIWNGGEMTGPGTTILAPGSHTFSDSTGTVRLLSGRTLRNEGTLTWSSNTTRVESGGILENAALMEYNGAGSDSLRSFVGPGTFTNNGTLRTTGTGELVLGDVFLTATNLTTTNADTFEVVSGALKVDNLSNYSVDFNTLTGGVYKVQGILVIGDADIATNAASITLDGPSSEIQDRNGANALQNLSTNNSAGSITLANSKSVTTSGAFTNQGSVTIGTGCTLGMDGNYEQTAGTTSIDTGGTLDPNDTALFTGGTLTGSGAVAGELNNAAAVSPGASPGTLSVNAYTQQSGGALDIQVGGNATSAFDRLVATGAATLAGTLNVSLIDGFTPSLGDTFPFLPYASRTGTFDQVNVPVFSDNLTFDLAHTPNATVLMVAEHDTVPPNTLLATAPANGAWVADDSVAVSWTGTDDHSPVGNLTYSTQLDAQPASPFSASTSTSLTGLAAGLHTFSVTAKDRVGNVDPTPAQLTFYVDTVTPETNFTQSPAEQSVADTSVAAFAWQGTDDQAPTDSLRFARSLDGAAYSAFDPSASTLLSGLGEGGHTFAVKARDLAGNVDPSPVIRSWKVDLTPPTVSFVSGPASGAHIGSTTVPVAWTAVDAIAPRDSLLFATSLDGALFSSFAHDSTATLNLIEGLHTFSVRAKDQVGRLGTASRSFTVDTTRPTVLLTQGPANGGFAMNAVTFGWAGVDNLTPNGSLVFSYRLDQGSDSPFAGPTSVLLTNLDPGAHTFEVKVRDLAGNESQSAATVTFTVDTVVPETAILTGPVEGSTEDTSSVALSWTGSDDRSPTDSLRYASRLDTGTFSVFSTSTNTTITGLSDGPHTVEVKARDLAGNEDPTPASRSFIADVTPPLVTITDGPAANAYLAVTEATFAWSATDAVSPPESLQYAYKLDGVVSAWAPVGSASLSLLAEGPHVFEAKAKDLVGRIGTQNRSFVVDLTAPTVQAPTARTEDGFKVRYTFTGFDNFGLQGFEAEIGTDPSFAAVLLDSTLQGGSGAQILFQGSPGHIYYARARALDRAGHLSPLSPVSNGAAIGNLADLILTDVQAPPTASSGQSVQVTWTVSNVGSGGTNVPQWFDQIYLSPTANLNLGTATVLGTVQNLTFLAPGDSYTNQHVFTLPQGISGTQYMFVVADYQNQQTESNGNNNSRSDSFQIDLSSYADLVPTGIVDIGPTVFSGTQATVIWTVKNNGNGRTNVDNWYDTVFLSPDGNFDYTLPAANQIKFLDQPLAQLQHVGALDPESTYTASLNVTLPPQIEGTYHLFVWSDISVTQTNQTVAEMGNVFENVSEQNNYIGDGFDVVLTPPADLVLSSFTAPGSALSGQTMNLSWTVRNSGLNPTFESFWNDRVFMSTDNVLDAGDTPVLTLGHTGVLARDAEYTAGGSITLDPSLSGSRWFFVTTDYDLRAYELDETNNSSSGSASTVDLSPWPDLAVSEQIVESTANAGSQLTLSWRVQNLGSGTPSGNWRERIYLSTSPTLNTGAASVLNTLTVSAATAELRTATVDLSPSLAGVYYIHVLTDADNNLFENTGETNNTGAGSQITVTAYPTVDLAVGNLVAPATLYSGNSYDIQWTVSNVNAGTTPSPNSWGETLYLSTDAVFSSGDTQLTGLTHSGALSPGASYTSHVSYQVPDGFSGQYYLLVRITPSAVRDGNTANDVAVTASAATFILTAPPDLTVTALNVTGSAVAGQPLHIVWTVANQGTGAPTTSNWDMGVYLSADPLPSGDDISLGSKLGPGSLPASSSYADSLDVTPPNYVSGAYYVLVQADAQSEVYEGGLESNNGSYQPITMTLPSASDLRVSSVVAPATASPAENVTVSWTIENLGENTAQGTIQDAVYVSLDGTFNSIEDPLVGILEREINLAPGASLQAVKSVRLDEAFTSDVQGNILEALPGVTPGQYYFIVRTDIRENLREIDPSNNLGVSSSLTDVTVPELVIGSSVNTSIAASQSRYYRISAPAGLDLTVEVNSNEDDATNEIFLAYGRVPTLNDFDLAGPSEFTADPSILVPSTQSGDYYVLVRALALPFGSTTETLTLRARALAFSLSAISPDYGGTQGHVTCTLRGAGLRDTTQVFLEASGIATPADRVTFLNTTELQVRWDLTQLPVATYDVVAKNGDETVRLPAAFQVQTAEDLRIETTSIHPDVIRDNSVAYFTFKFSNTANWDAPHLQSRLFYPAAAELISLTSSPKLKKRSDLFPDTAIPIQGDFYAVEDTTVGSNLHVVDVLASNLPPGAELICTLGFRNFPGNPFSVRALTEVMDTETFVARQSAIIESARNAMLQSPESVPAGVLALAGTPQAFRDTALVHTYVDAGLLESADIMQFSMLGQPASAALLQNAVDGPRARFGIGLTPQAADDSCGALLPTPECVPDQGPLQNVLPDCAICLDASIPVTLRFPVEVTAPVLLGLCENLSGSVTADARVVSPCDPNQMTGPAGTGVPRWVASKAVIPYTVDFENLSEVASAPAQAVSVDVPLDADLNLSRFRLGNIGFGTHVVQVPPGSSSFTDEQFYADLGLRVRIVGGVDVTNHKAFWTFQSIDPNTGLPPTNPYVGFLPVNDPFGRGQGFVSYSLEPMTGVVTGAQVTAQASIVFDHNPVLLTNTAMNTVDAGLPISALQAPTAIDLTTYRLQWTASDPAGGSGFNSVAVYVKQDNGPFTLFQSGLTGPSVLFDGIAGHVYGFYTLANDVSGNLEAAKTQPEVQVNIGVQGGVDGGPEKPLFRLMQNQPNPFAARTAIGFSLAEPGRVDLRVFDLAGRLVATVVDGEAMAAGPHRVNFDASKLGSGIYFYRLQAGKNVTARKMVLIQ